MRFLSSMLSLDGDTMAKLWHRVKHEFLEVLPFFLITFPLWWRTGSFTDGNRDLWREIVWPHFWAIQLWLVVLIFVYCATRELVRILGRDRVVHIFFGHPGPRPSR